MSQPAAPSGHNVLEPVRILAPDGELVAPIPVGLTEADLLAMYRWMVRLRVFDTRALLLQRQGRLGTYPPFSGQEASQVGSALAFDRSDWLVPSYRDLGTMMVHGIPLVKILRYWQGDEWGSHLPGLNTLPVVIPIATHLPHAVGLAWAAKLLRQHKIAVAYMGDGATSEGDFHEALNFAGVFRLPVVFICENNLYAISVPFHRQSAAPIAARGAGYGIPGVQVDGNDVLAVYSVTATAVARARAGEGATLIEALTYRYGAHTTADDPNRYRSADEALEWQEQRDPIQRLRRFLEHQHLWDAGAETRLWEEAAAEVSAAVAESEAMPRARPEDVFDYVFSDLPWFLQEQRAAMLAHVNQTREAKGNA